MTAVLKYIWIYLNVFARCSFRFFLLSFSLLIERSLLLFPHLPAPCHDVAPSLVVVWLGSLCHAFPCGQCTALDSAFLEICGKPVHMPACKQSMSLPFLQKQGGSNAVLTICATFLKLHFCQAFQRALCDHRAHPKHLHCWGQEGFQCVVY